jgi:hypothetical protein
LADEFSCRCTSTPSDDIAAGARKALPRPPGSDVYRCLGVPDGLINIIAALIGAGVLERYPRLRSCRRERRGLDPVSLDRMDFEFEDRFRDLMKLKPSEYWRRQGT